MRGAGWAGISGALLETARTANLSVINGAFGLSTAEWTIVCFVSGILVALVGMLMTTRSST